MKDTGRKFAEIRLRACQRIGQLSAELEKATANQHTVLLPNDEKKQTKEQSLAEAGISTSTANRDAFKLGTVPNYQ